MTGLHAALFTVALIASVAFGALTAPGFASLPPFETCTTKGC